VQRHLPLALGTAITNGSCLRAPDSLTAKYGHQAPLHSARTIGISTTGDALSAPRFSLKRAKATASFKVHYLAD